tara:strand:- start:990 stop:1382 length:393 start_codon:yes stop_codon:yes gene_type:complete
MKFNLPFRRRSVFQSDSFHRIEMWTKEGEFEVDIPDGEDVPVAGGEPIFIGIGPVDTGQGVVSIKFVIADALNINEAFDKFNAAWQQAEAEVQEQTKKQGGGITTATEHDLKVLDSLMEETQKTGGIVQP